MIKYSDPIWPWQKSMDFPWATLQFYRHSRPFPLAVGTSLNALCMAYETWGDPTNPPVVIFHALTGDSHVARHHKEDRAGWWEGVVGAGKSIDPDHYYIIVVNSLGGAMGSTGPSSMGPHRKPWGRRFPHLSLFDMARAAHEAVWHLTQGRPAIIVGGSMGGMVALAYASLFPHDTQAVMAIGSPIVHSPWAISFHTVGRHAIQADRDFQGGEYYTSDRYPEKGLQVARMTDMISYRSPQAFAERFGRRFQTDTEEEFQISSYLTYQGKKLLNRFDANSYLVLTDAMDRFDLREGPIERLAEVPVVMVAIDTDVLYPPSEIEAHSLALQSYGIDSRFELMCGPWGHDTFLVDQRQMNEIVGSFLPTSNKIDHERTP